MAKIDNKSKLDISVLWQIPDTDTHTAALYARLPYTIDAKCRLLIRQKKKYQKPSATPDSALNDSRQWHHNMKWEREERNQAGGKAQAASNSSDLAAPIHLHISYVPNTALFTTYICLLKFFFQTVLSHHKQLRVCNVHRWRAAGIIYAQLKTTTQFHLTA